MLEQHDLLLAPLTEVEIKLINETPQKRKPSKLKRDRLIWESLKRQPTVPKDALRSTFKLPHKRGAWTLPKKYDILVSRYHRTRLLNYFNGVEKIMLVFLHVYCDLIPNDEYDGVIYQNAILRLLHMNDKQANLDFVFKLLRAYGIQVFYKSVDGRFVLTELRMPSSLKDLVKWMFDFDKHTSVSSRVPLVSSDATFTRTPVEPARPTQVGHDLIEFLDRYVADTERIRSVLPELVRLNTELEHSGEIGGAAARQNRWIILQCFKQPIQEYSFSAKSPRINGLSFNRFSKQLRNLLERLLDWTVCDLTSCGATIFASLYGCDLLGRHVKSPKGAWQSILDEGELAEDLKPALKVALIPLLYGSRKGYAKFLCSQVCGRKTSEIITNLPVVREVAIRTAAVLEEIVNGRVIQLIGGEEITASSLKEARSVLAYQIQSYELAYAGNIALEAERHIPGSLRAFLHDGFTLHHNLSQNDLERIIAEGHRIAETETGITVRSEIEWPPSFQGS